MLCGWGVRAGMAMFAGKTVKLCVAVSERFGKMLHLKALYKCPGLLIYGRPM